MEIVWNALMEEISALYVALHSITGCSCGGCCHIVTDDDNLDNDSLDYVINKCSDANNSAIDKDISKLICQLLKKLTLEQRQLINDFYFEIGGVMNEASFERYMEVRKNYDNY